MTRDFGKYELVEKIGVGGMAEVFLAKSFGAEGLEKILVIKRILPDLSENPRFVEMFISEAKIAVDLNHPNVVQIYDFGKHDGMYYLAMEFVDGADLGHLMSASRRGGTRFSIGNALYVAIEIAKGLQYAHTKKDRYGEPLDIVHQDVSPQNALISQDGTVKIVDFGIAKATSVAEVQPNSVRGKFAYMSPEQASGKQVDHRSDLFSLGVVLFEMLAGRQLFKGNSQDEIMSMVKSAVVPDLASLNADVSDELCDLLYRVLSREPSDRHQSARELQRDLTRVLYGLDELYDSGTMASLFRKLESDIDPDAHQGYAATGGGRTQTSMVSTATGGTNNTRANTPVTRVVDDSDTGVEIHSRERKEVVIVVGELVGLFDLRTSVGQNKWLQVLQEYTRIVDSIAYKNDAVVHRVNEDGFAIILGIPVSSENDAKLAVRVTMDLHEAVSGINTSLEYPIQLSAGIATGDVILEQEVDKTGRRYSWSFFGKGHELAERLAHAGMAREILVGGQVFRRIKREYNGETVERVEHPDDDTSQEVQAYLLTGPKSGRDKLHELKRSYHTFRGREIPLKSLRELYRETILEQTAHMAMVVGRQGIGKSTLVEEFLRGLDQRNVRIVRGVIGLHHRDVPLGSMGVFLAEILRLGDTDDLRAVRRTLSTRITALFPDEDEAERKLILHSLGGIFNIKWPESAFDEFTGNERRDRIFLSLQKLLMRFAEKKPIILALDDAQNIDSMTLQFVTQFFNATRQAPAMVIFTADDTGPHIVSRDWQALQQAQRVHVEELHELGAKESESLVRDLLRMHRIDDESLVGEILRRAGGNPLYIKEVVEVLRDRGMLKDSGDRRQLQSEDDAQQWLPSSVEGLIRSRIDRLPLRLKVVLQKTAFLWSPFTGQDVGLVLPDEPFDDLEELVSLGLLDRLDREDGVQVDTFDPNQRPPRERQYAFCNALTQEVAAAGLLEDETAHLHRRLADHLLNQPTERQSTASALIARHFDGAGERERSVEFYYRAADEALDQYGAAESLRLCDKVLERVENDSDFYYKTLKIRAKALGELGLRDECREVLVEIEELAFERDDDPVEQADVLIQQARFFFDQSELRKAREYAERARELAEERDDRSHVAAAWLVEAMVFLNEGNRDDALELAVKAVDAFSELIDEPGGVEGLVRAQNVVGVVHRQAGRHHEALEAYEEALEVAEEAELRKWRRYLLNNAGLALAYLGEFTQALERYNEALERVRQLGHRTEESNLLINIGHCHLLRGEYDDAMRSVRRGIYLARKTNAVHNLADGLISIGAIHVEKGDHKKAEHSLHEGLRLADSIPNVYLSVHATLLLARSHLAAGTNDAAKIALMQAEDALERSEKAEMKWGMGYAHSLMARAHKILGKREQAIAESKKAVDLVDRGEVFALEDILYHHTQILPDEEEYEDDRRQAIMRAREVIIHRRDKIDDDEVRKTYMSKPMNRQIFNVSKLLLE